MDLDHTALPEMDNPRVVEPLLDGVTKVEIPPCDVLGHDDFFDVPSNT